MKRTLFLCLAGALTLAAQPRGMGWASETRATGWFGTGPSVSINPIARNLDNVGWNIAGGVGVTGRYFGIMLDATYNDFRLNRRNLYNVGADNGHQRFWGFTLDPVFHVNQRGPVDFYITGGGGIYGDQTALNQRFYSGNYFRSNDYFSNTIYKPGVDGGVGFAYSFGGGRIKVIAESRFHHVFTGGSGASFIPVTLGVSF
jgi:hypothetical protein